MKLTSGHYLLAVSNLLLGVEAALLSNNGPVVDLGYAAFLGNSTSPAGQHDGPVTFFGGIPYAQPPVGNLRYRAPRQLDEKTRARNVTDARNFGPPCIQQPAAVGVGSEDCLRLNIWKPSRAVQSLPVIVYIHGGGFTAGTPQGFPMYDWISQHPGGMIGVSITYRLNLLGFLAGSAVLADGDLNTGLLDQRAALEWVQRHIHSFGGDPDNVSIVGESAGGASTVMQAVAYGGTKPAPFKRVVSQSIGFGPTPAAAQSENTFYNITTAVGCADLTADVMSCLRNASMSALVAAINSVPNGALVPVTEGPAGFLPSLPSLLIASGNFSTVDFLGGHCTNDGRSFVGGKPAQFVTDDDVRRLVFARWPGVSNATIDKALALYPSPNVTGSPFATQYDRASTMAQEIVFGCMDSFFAAKAASRKSNVFAYRWNAADAVLFNAQPFLGVMHTSDLYFLFDGTNTSPNAGFTFTHFNSTEAELSEEAIAYWTSFGSSGTPSTTRKRTSPEWTAFQAETTHKRMVLTKGSETATGSAMETVPDDELERCAFWMSPNVVAETRV